MNKTREQIIHSMCGTWRHDYGLIDEQSKNSLFRSMAQIFDNDIASELMMQSDCDNYEEELENMRDEIDSLEEQNKGLQSLLDLKQQEISVLESKEGDVKTCDGCIWYDELHPSYCDCLEPCSRFKHGWDKDRYEQKQN